MSQVEAPNYLRKWEFGDSACYAELPKVAGAVIEAFLRSQAWSYRGILLGSASAEWMKGKGRSSESFL